MDPVSGAAHRPEILDDIVISEVTWLRSFVRGV